MISTVIGRDNTNNCIVYEYDQLGLRETEALMTNLSKLRCENGVQDMLIVLTHPPSLSLGVRKLNEDDLHQPLEFFQKQGIELYKTTRGGGLTYHWPGQIHCYPVLKLAPHEQNVSKYMTRLEEVCLRLLTDFGITAYRRREAAAQIGLWYHNCKIASMGIHLSRWVTSYGFALNLCGETRPALSIRPCGLEGVKLVTVEDILGIAPARKKVVTSLFNHFSEVFKRNIVQHTNIRSDTNFYFRTCIS